MNKVSCSECKKTFSSFSNLRRHAVNFHPNEQNKLAPLKKSEKVFKFNCEKCKRKFNVKNNFSVHKRKCLSQEPGCTGVSTSLGYPCALCNENISKDNLENHLEKVHNIQLIKETIEFTTQDEFMAWKVSLELEQHVRFVKKHGNKRNASGEEKVHFYCHRSGHYRAKGKGIRQIKTQGSKKINFYCPAHIRLLVNTGGTCKVNYLKTHVGHKNELCHLTLTRPQRETLAAKIAEKVPLDDILDEVRDSIVSEKLERLHLLTRKDLLNIESSYNLNNDSCRHRSGISPEAINIDAWITKIQNSKCTLFYKSQNSLCADYPDLKLDDFFLIIMNEIQCEILNKFGDNCICIDRTHCRNSYGFELITLMVIDDMCQGFPCAFFISNRIDQVAISIFYERIKKYSGSVKPKIFMSDTAEYFFNSWILIMEPPDRQLYCSWHVDGAWRKNLSQIKNKEKQVEVYRLLRTLMEERSEQTFEIILDETDNELFKDPDTHAFGQYLQDNFLENYKSWAYSFRLDTGVIDNMHLEQIHKTLKYIYCHGKNLKRLDKCIFILMKFIKNTLFDRMILLHEDNITSKEKALRNRHIASLSLDATKIIEVDCGWQIPSTTSSELYSIQENNRECTCNFICKECNTCLHKYVCSCLDNSIKWNMCKHIHLISRYVTKRNSQPPKEITLTSLTNDSENSSVDIDTVENDIDENDESFIKMKYEFLNEIKVLTDSIKDEEELNIFKRCIASVQPTIEALRCSKKVSSQFNSENNFPVNKKINIRNVYVLRKETFECESLILDDKK